MSGSFVRPKRRPAAADGKPARPTIDGTWRVTITPVDCTSEAEFPQFNVLSNMAFAFGGTLVESTSNPRFQPGQRMP